MHRSSVRKNVPQKQRVRRQDFEVFGSVEEKSVKGGRGGEEAGQQKFKAGQDCGLYLPGRGLCKTKSSLETCPKV